MPTEKLRGWRKIANAIWAAPADPQIFGTLEIDATRLLAYIGEARARGCHMTPTHLVVRAVALGLTEAPELNVRLVGGRIVARSSIDVFTITSVKHGGDLSGVKIEGADQKTASEVAEEVDRRATALKLGADREFSRAKRFMDALPLPLLRAALRLSAAWANEVDADIRVLGVRRSPFGSAMVTSVGMFGLPTGFAPLAWMYGVPILVLAGEITDKPLAIDGRVEIRPVLPLTATIDHRFADAWQISRFVKPLRAYLENPARVESLVAALGTASQRRTA